MIREKTYRFSRTSERRLSSCEDNLIRVFNLAIKRTDVDFGIACGYRSVKEQQQLYAQGRTEPGSIVTYVDGVSKKSKHNYTPSQAVDVFAWVNNTASWDKEHLIYIAGVVMCCAKELGVKLRWGGNWDCDGEIISDQRFQDLPHYELY